MTYQVEAFIEGEMAEGKSGTLDELLTEARAKRNPLAGVEVEMQPKGIAKNIMGAIIYGKKL